MKFKLSKMSKKKQIAIACAVAAGASAAALVILGAKARIQVAQPVGTQVDDRPIKGLISYTLTKEEARHKGEKDFKFPDKVHNSVD